MAATRQPSATDSVAFEIDAKVVRSEAIRAIRGFACHLDRPRGPLSKSPKSTSFYAIVRIMRDLELTLTAISHSLAEGVDQTTGGPSARS